MGPTIVNINNSGELYCKGPVKNNSYDSEKAYAQYRNLPASMQQPQVKFSNGTGLYVDDSKTRQYIVVDKNSVPLAKNKDSVELSTAARLDSNTLVSQIQN